MIIRLPRTFPAVPLFLVIPDVAYAHMPFKGIHNFYNGVLHPVLVPAHLLLLVALGLFFGQQGPSENKTAIFVFLLSIALGLIFTGFSAGSNFEVIVLAGAAIFGLLVATSLRLPGYWCVIAGALAGLLIGLDSAQEALSGRDRVAALFGSGVASYLLMLYPMGFAEYFNNRHWQKVGIRIIGG